MSERDRLMQAPETSVSVRMYRPGFGDCFLLAFPRRGQGPLYLLIDCGVHAQFAGGSERIRDIVDDIHRVTGGHLHRVVVTHEHGDHVSGFHAARKSFGGRKSFAEMTIDEVWLGWTEDPENALARRLDKKRKMMVAALHASHHSLAAAGSSAAANVAQLLGFYAAEEMPPDQPIPAEPFAVSTRDARDQILELAREEKYFQPKGPPLTLPGVDDVRIFVLGPPEDERALLAASPTGQEGEVYEGADEAHGSRSSEDSLASVLAKDKELAERHQPFAGNHRIPIEWVKSRRDSYRFFHDHYGFGDNDGTAWRRIDEDWQNPAESLALKLDSATNNTSLVLAIELMKEGKVLLFPGDAQVGNWKSWHDGGWTHRNGLARGERVTAADLLRRTVLYKVGHHGSHNATLREKGLELMISDDLTAMIPVDEKWARARRPHPWKMPFGPMYEDLRRRTKDRILRTDQGHIRRKGEATSAAWRAFHDAVTVKDLYLELPILDQPGR